MAKRIFLFLYILIIIALSPSILSGCAHYPFGKVKHNAPGAADIYLGMPSQEVMAQWGDPIRVQVAGATESGNERWIYQSVGSLDANSGRVVYFEDGHVAGWESADTSL